MAYGRRERISLPHAALAHTSCKAVVASSSARVLNRARPGVELEVTGASVAVFAVRSSLRVGRAADS